MNNQTEDSTMKDKRIGDLRLSPWERQQMLRRDRNRRYYMRHREGKTRNAPERRVMVHWSCLETTAALLNRLLLEAVAKGTHPWRTQSEQFEDLIRRGLKSLREDPTVANAMPGLEAMALLNEVGAQRRQAQALVSRLHEEVNELMAVGARTSALQHYRSVLDVIRKMPPTAHTDWAIKKLQHDFPELAKVKKIPGVSLRIMQRRSRDDDD